MSLKKRYRPLWVVLHWLMALLIFITFGIGLFSLADQPNTSAKIVPLGVHMALGIAILVIVIIRYGMRLLIFKPPRRAAAPAGAILRKQPILLERLTPITHALLYFCTALMALLGILIALPADLFSSVWGASGAALPGNFYVYPARAWHGALSLLLMVLIGQHVLAAVYHQFLRGENYLGRMWFAPKASGPAKNDTTGEEG
jgi:cytochrome b561